MYYHGWRKRYQRRFFEGWYFKHRAGERVFAAIPGVWADGRGRRAAFVQVISNEGSAFHEFPYEAFSADPDALSIHVGDNRFGRNGLSLDLPGTRAQLRYGAFTPLSGGDIMGPFARLPFLECYHGVISLRHDVRGYVESAGEGISFDGGSGYLETDWGRSFPRSWVWIECHDFAGAKGATVMLALADIPFLGARFGGIICVCQIGGVQHRIASYHGARLLWRRDGEGSFQAAIGQGRYALRVRVEYERGSELLAPVLGNMSRTITEYPSARIEVELKHGCGVLLSAQGDGCGFERA